MQVVCLSAALRSFSKKFGVVVFRPLQAAQSRGRNFITSASLNDIFTVQDEEDFKKKVLESKEPVILDFFATWCGPCKMLLPRLETVVGGKQNKIHLAKVDVDELENIASKYKVTSVPSVFCLKNGQVVDQFIGLKDEDEIRAFVGKVIGD